MDVKMPKDMEKTKEIKSSLKDSVNQYGKSNMPKVKQSVDVNRANTQEEDEWEWQEAIRAAISDNRENDDFILPVFQYPNRGSDSVPKDENIYSDEMVHESDAEEEMPAKQKQVNLEAVSVKDDSYSEAKPSFWNKLGELVGINEPSGDEVPKAETINESEIESDPAEEVFAELEKAKSSFKVVEKDEPWDFNAAEQAVFQNKDSINFDDYAYSDDPYDEDIAETVRETVEAGEEKEKWSFPPIFSAVFALLEQKFQSINEKRRESRKIELADSVIEEPASLEKEARRYARPVASITFRSRFAFVISLLMVIVATVFEISGKGIFGIGENGALMTGVLMIMQLMVMLLCVEVPLRGVCSIIKGKVTAESLIAISCLATLIDGAVILLSHNTDRGLPFAVVSALSVVFGMRGLRSYYIAMRNSLRVVSKVKSLWGIVTDSESIEERNALKKLPDTTDGFYKNLVRRDICEHIYTYAAPIMLIVAVVFAFMSTVVRGRGGEFIHALAALAAMTASFSCMSAYSMPFKIVSIITRRSGCAVAGWTGADKMTDADGAFITDNDLFPKGTQYISDVRLTDVATKYKAMEYAGSLMLASGSALEHPFRELLREHDVTPVFVDGFSCYEGGGVGGVIRGENVLVGTAAFMNLMGVRMPEEFAKSRGVFLSINRRFAAIFTVSYVPSKVVQKSMVAMKSTRVNMLFALRDFNVSPQILQKMFKVSMDGIEYIPLSDCYRITETDKVEEADAAGVISVGSLGLFAQTVARGAMLRQITVLNTAVSLLGSAIGLFLVFYMCWNGPISSVTSWAMALFMFAMHLVTIILSNMIKRRK